MARVAFGDFVLDTVAGELCKGQERILMPEQPLNLLLCLLEHPGQLMGREVLQKRVWAGDIHVGYEDGLNNAAWRLRQILGDTAEKRLFVETIPKKGYRFVGKVVHLPEKPPPSPESCPLPVFRPDSGWTRSLVALVNREHRRWDLWLGGILALGMAASGIGLWVAFRPQPWSVDILPLQNATRDPALDYFAAALRWQVNQDLQEARGAKKVSLLEGPLLARNDLGPQRNPSSLKLDWTLARDEQGYRVAVKLTGTKGQPRGEATFLATPEDLHAVHRKISAFVAQQAAQNPKDPGGDPDLRPPSPSSR